MDNEQALKDFVKDIDCLDKLHKWTNNVNIFDVLKIANNEIRHSNVLAWLLNSNENHNLGDWFLRNVILQLIKKNKNLDVIKLSTMNLYSFNVYRELYNTDILMISEDEKVVIVIENKIWAGETGEQLSNYPNTIKEKYPADEGFYHVFVYLTPDGYSPQDDEAKKIWSILDYKDIVVALDGDEERRNYVKSITDNHANLIIGDYLEILRRDIVTDEELKNACDEIYRKHKQALDLIYELKTDENTIVWEYVSKALQLYQDKLIFDKNNKSKLIYCFYTPEMDAKLYNDADKKRYYYCTFRLNDKNILSCHFEIDATDSKIPSEYEDNIKKIIENSPLPKDKKNTDLTKFSYKTLISSYTPTNSKLGALVRKKEYKTEEGLKSEEEIIELSKHLIDFMLEELDKILSAM